MGVHRFGGAWTEEKLERLRKYLPAYTRIFQANERARYFWTMYIDAFAGSGSRIDSRRQNEEMNQLSINDSMNDGSTKVSKSSVRIALETEPPFDRYVLIDKKRAHIETLELLKNDYPNRASQIEIMHGDANQKLQELCSQPIWRKYRAVAFLDPYGMQVDWSTIVAIASTRGIDLWLLWPLGMGVNRLLLNKKPPPDNWARALTRTLGTEEWRDQFYSKKKSDQLALLAVTAEEHLVRNAHFTEIEQFFFERLSLLFPFVSKNPLYLFNSQKNTPPMFLLYFAGHNKAGLNIAQHILSN